MKSIAIIFAGGVGNRMGESALPKQYIVVQERPILIRTLDNFEQHPQIDEIYVACRKEWIDYTKDLFEEYRMTKVKSIVAGGETALHSIYNALVEARAHNSEEAIVLVHDGVRPLISKRLITDLIYTTKAKDNAITCTPCHETIIVSEDLDIVSSVPIRRHTFAAQAPQAFLLGDLIAAHDEIRKVNPQYKDIVDCCTLYNVLGKDITMVTGNIGNIKITRPEDVFILEGLIKYQRSEAILGLSLLDG